MIKSLLIKLRRKPKAVREQVALIAAGGFTFAVFVPWAFNLPSKFIDDGSRQTAGLFSTLKDDLSEGAPDLGQIADEFRGVVASSTEPLPEDNEAIFFEESTIEIELDPSLSDTNQKPVRIATTSSNSAGLE